MSAESIKSAYASNLKETVTVRRYAGVAPSRTNFDADVRGHVTGYQAHELIGSIIQGDRKVIVLADDLLARGITLPLTTDDKVYYLGSELRIMQPTPRTALDGTVVAVELQVRGI